MDEVRQGVVVQGRCQQLAVVAVGHLLVERPTDALHGAAHHLPFDCRRVDRASAVLDYDHLLDLHPACFPVDRHLGELGAETGRLTGLGVASVAEHRRLPAAEAHRALGDFLERNGLVGRSLDPDLSVHDLQVFGCCFERGRGQLQGLLPGLTGGLNHWRPDRVEDLAAAGGAGEGSARGVAGGDRDPFRFDAEGLGRDQGQTRVRAGDVGRTDVNLERTVALERAGGRRGLRAARPGPERDADSAALRPCLLAVLPRGVGLQRLQHLALAHAGPGHSGGHRLAGLRGVHEPHLERVEPQLLGQLIEHGLNHERRLRRQRRTVGADRGLVRDDLVAADGLIRRLVGTAEQGAGECGHGRWEAAAVHRQLGFQRRQLAAPLGAGANRDPGRGRGSGGQHLLGSAHHQSHRALELRRGDGQERFVKQELSAEAAADRRADHAHLLVGQAEHVGDRVPDVERRLGRAVDRHSGAHRVRVDQCHVRFEVGLVNRRGGEAPFDHGVGGGEAGGEVAAVKAYAVRHVGRRGTRAAVVAGAPGAVRRRLRGLAGQAVGPHRRRRRGLGLFQGDRGVERPVVDLDQFRCIRAPGLVLGQDQGDRMADEDDPIAREHEHRPAIGREFGQIRCRDDGGDAGQGLRRRGIDAQHLGVRVRAGDQTDMEQPGPFEVAAVAQRALDLGFALEQFCGGADRRHVRLRR